MSYFEQKKQQSQTEETVFPKNIKETSQENQMPVFFSTEIRPGIICLTLNRPNCRNAFSLELLQKFQAELIRLEQCLAGEKSVGQNQTTDNFCVPSLLILNGTGTAFCGGLDLKEAVLGSPIDVPDSQTLWNDTNNLLNDKNNPPLQNSSFDRLEIDNSRIDHSKAERSELVCSKVDRFKIDSFEKNEQSCSDKKTRRIKKVPRAFRMPELVAEILIRLSRLPILVVAIVNGPACGGGGGLAAVSDFVIASDRFVWMFPEVRRGFDPALLFPLLRRRLPPGFLREMILTGLPVSAERAYNAGLVHRLVSADELTAFSNLILQFQQNKNLLKRNQSLQKNNLQNLDIQSQNSKVLNCQNQNLPTQHQENTRNNIENTQTELDHLPVWQIIDSLRKTETSAVRRAKKMLSLFDAPSELLIRFFRDSDFKSDPQSNSDSSSDSSLNSSSKSSSKSDFNSDSQSDFNLDSQSNSDSGSNFDSNSNSKLDFNSESKSDFNLDFQSNPNLSSNSDSDVESKAKYFNENYSKDHLFDRLPKINETLETLEMFGQKISSEQANFEIEKALFLEMKASLLRHWQSWNSAAAQEGLRAFFEKRTPCFQNPFPFTAPLKNKDGNNNF